jgi:hypothetical protein
MGGIQTRAICVRNICNIANSLVRYSTVCVVADTIGYIIEYSTSGKPMLEI